MELFGLVSFVDEYAFGDLASFRAQFAHLTNQEVFETLKARLRPMCHRTLRRQVTTYVPFTRRHPMVQPFTPEESEDRLYHLVSDYLRRDNLQALPKSQRSLMTLVLRKLLASSSFAIAAALGTLGNRLKDRLGRDTPEPPEQELAEDFEALDETADEWPEDEPHPDPLSDAGRAALEQEVADLEGFRSLAVSITSNAKGRALLVALEHAFGEAERLRSGEALNELVDQRRTAIQQTILERNVRYFEAEAEKLDSWADDLKVALERDIKEMDRQIREARRKASRAASLETKLAGQKQIKALEAQRTSKRRTLFDAQDQIERVGKSSFRASRPSWRRKPISSPSWRSAGHCGRLEPFRFHNGDLCRP